MKLTHCFDFLSGKDGTRKRNTTRDEGESIACLVIAIVLSVVLLLTQSSWSVDDVVLQDQKNIFDSFEDYEELSSIEQQQQSRRLSEATPPVGDLLQHKHDLEHVLALATRSPEDTFTDVGSSGEDGEDEDEDHSSNTPLRVLVIVTTLAEYDKGTRGTTSGADRLMNLVVPILVDGVTSMIERGWHVDVYLICGFERLVPTRRQMIMDALPQGVGLEVWEDAIPYYYVKKFNGELKQPARPGSLREPRHDERPAGCRALRKRRGAICPRTWGW